MRFYVSLGTDEFERLLSLAHAERRRPQDQAAVLIAKSLADAPSGTEPGPPTEAMRDRETVGAGR